MKKTYLAAASVAAFLGVVGFANAQGTGTNPSQSGTATNQCWDESSNLVRDRSGTNATGPSGNTSSTVGSTTPTTPPGTSSGGTSSNAAASARPPGMPKC